jgi:hypothetical protein
MPSGVTEADITVSSMIVSRNCKAPKPEEIPRLQSGVMISFLTEGTGFIITRRGFLKEPPTLPAGFHCNARGMTVKKGN